MKELDLIRAVDLFCRSHQEGEAFKDPNFVSPKARYRMWFHAGQFTAVVSVFVGPRGGVYEELIVLDLNEYIEMDRLLLHNVYPSDMDMGGYEAMGLVDRPGLKDLMEKDGEAAIPAFLNLVFVMASVDQGGFEDRLRNTERQPSGQPWMVSGGLPSLGRR